MRIANFLLVIMFLLLVGCADEYRKSVVLNADVITIDGDRIKKSTNVDDYQPKMSSDVDVSIEFKIGKFEYIYDIEIPYTMFVSASKRQYKLPVEVVAYRDSMASTYFKVFVGTDEIVNEMSIGFERTMEIIAEMEGYKTSNPEVITPQPEDEPETERVQGVVRYVD